MIYDIIIIGAGISGLYSYHLLKKINIKYKVLILESGYNHKIYYTGDYLGKIENMGSATNALNNTETLISKIYFD